MIYLLLSIVCSTIIVLLFRSFREHGIDNFPAIVVNYLTCSVIGILLTSKQQLAVIPSWSGLPYAVVLGLLFITLFYLIARTTQFLGVAVASVAQKLSFVIPVIAGILMFSESFTWLKLAGFILAVAAVILISSRRHAHFNLRDHGWLPFIVFAGSGICDLVVKIVEAAHLGEIHKSTFTTVLFGTAFLSGLTILAFRRKKPKFRDMVAGFFLGIPNYGSIYFLIASLQQPGWEASQVFPINNVGIILLSAVSAWLLFSEHLNLKQMAGLALAVASIVILV